MKKQSVKWLWTGILSLLAVGTFALSACGGNMQENNAVELNKKELCLNVGESEKLTVSVDPADAMDKTIVWKSDDEKIATVQDGLVKGIAEGETLITATSAGKSDTCKVVVSAAQEQSPAQGDSSSSTENEPSDSGVQDPTNGEEGAIGNR